MEGLRSYQAIFCNRGKVSGRWKSKEKDIEDVKEVGIHQIIDTYIEPHCVSSNIRGQSECLNYTGTNTQIHGIWRNPSNHTRVIKPKEVRFTGLPNVHRNLYIGDINSIQQWIQEMGKKPTTVINLSSIRLEKPKPRSGEVVLNVPFRDSRTICFKEFYPVFLSVRDLLDEHLPARQVLLACQAGVNRSSAMAVAYAITKGMGCNETIEYLADQKYLVSPNWDNLSNSRFRIILRQLHSSRAVEK